VKKREKRRKFGLTWRYSPARRVIQVLSLSLFLYLFFYIAWPYAKVFSETTFSDKEWLPVEFFLWIDPLVGLATSIATRYWSVALFGMGGIFLACLLFPRGFCGYICPLGTLIDGFDWLIGRHLKRLHLRRPGGWAHLRYFLLTAVIIAAFGGVLLAGYMAAIPVLTRGLLFTGGRLQLGLMKNWSFVRPAHWTLYLSIGLFAMVFLIGLMGKRFWCSYLCPSGATFSLFNVFRLRERKVEDTCINCGKCAKFCSFNAIKEDFTTRTMNCTFCQTCGASCPTNSIKFAWRWDNNNLKEASSPPVVERGVSRRGFILSAAVGVVTATAIRSGLADAFHPKRELLRPPGSVPESRFLDLCIRCGECMKVCPGPVLHPAGLEAGLEAMWTPIVVPIQAGCHQDCNFCTQICPTGAIRKLSINEKRKTHIGLAVINTETCLPHSGQRDCRVCFEECKSAGYNAIKMREIEINIGDIAPEGLSEQEFEWLKMRLEMSRIEAPFVDPEACVGCGLCEYRCHAAYVKREKIFSKSAIAVQSISRV
jgi:ferredoxin